MSFTRTRLTISRFAEHSREPKHGATPKIHHRHGVRWIRRRDRDRIRWLFYQTNSTEIHLPCQRGTEETKNDSDETSRLEADRKSIDDTGNRSTPATLVLCKHAYQSLHT